MKISKQICLCLFLAGVFICSCSKSGPGSLFRKMSPHEKYQQALVNAGLHETALGREWINAAENSLGNPLSVNLPYKEKGYFPAEKARANTIRFKVEQGAKVTINLKKRPEKGFMIYADLWEEKENNNKKLLAYADTGETSFSYETDKTGSYLLRIQPELMRSGDYTLTISTGPSLAFPVKNGKIESFWGSDRDAGIRRHEGIDIFAPFRTPALAVASGIITRVTLNNLGGKVVFMRPEGKNYNLYYAHLDEQLAREGNIVNVGDTLGLIGTTGNAIGGPPHLHFGIYTTNGAVNPLPYVNQTIKLADEIRASESSLNKIMRISSTGINMYEGPAITFPAVIKLPEGTLAEIIAATSSWYKVLLPDGRYGFVRNTSLNPIENPIKQIKLAINNLPLLDRPDTTAGQKDLLTQGQSIKVLGAFQDFWYISAGNEKGWIIKL